MTHSSRENRVHVDHDRGLQGHQASKPSSAPLVGHSTYGHQLPLYFIVRPDSTMQTASGAATIKGAMVPLIPVDQLPPWLGIVGVPRELDIEQTKGSKNLGEIRKVFDFYDVYFPSRKVDANARGLPMSTVKSQRKNYIPGSSSESQVDPVDSTRYNGIPNDNSEFATREGHRQDSSASAQVHERSHIPFDSNGNGTGSLPKSLTVPLNHGILSHASPESPNPPRHSSSYPVPHSGELVSSPIQSNPQLLNNSTPSSSGEHSPTQPYTVRSTAITRHRDSNENNATPGMVTRANSHCRGNPTGIVYCRHFAHHGTCKWGRACFYVHGMPQTVEGLREVGLENIPAWYKAQQTGFAMGMAMLKRWGGNNSFGAGPARGGFSMMDSMGIMDAGMVDMEGGGGAMTQQEWNELRARLERQDAAEQRAKAARDKQSGRVGKSKPREKTREVAVEFQPALFSERDYDDDDDFAPIVTREARSRRAGKDVPNLDMQAKANKCNGQGKGKIVPIEESLMDL